MTSRPLISALLVTAAGTAALAFPQLASAEGLLTDRFTLSLGTFMLDTTTELSLNGSAGTPGTTVDFNRDLGFTDTDRIRFDASWRFAQRHKLNLMYFDINDSNTRSLSRALTIGDTTYPVNASIKAKNSTEVIALSYQYDFVQRDTWQIGGAFGLHIVGFNFEISGQGNVGNLTGQFSQESAETTAPLPVFGLNGIWEFSDKWYLKGGVQYFELAYDKYDGKVTDIDINVTRMFGANETWGIGAGWNQFDTDVDVEGDKFDGSLGWKYEGAKIFVTASF